MTGFIGVGQLKYILTNLGEKMTDDEVDELLKAVDTSSGQVNYTGTEWISGSSSVVVFFFLLPLPRSGMRANERAADLVRTILAN